ncbi:MAG: hypothetical protein V1793_04135 [Pseudomonadota bacterium]
MKKTSSAFTFLMGSLVVIACLLAPPSTIQAKDAIDQMADILDAISPNPFERYGINGQAVRDSRELINCLADGGDPIACIVNFKATPIGQRLSGESEDLGAQAMDAAGLSIPTWIWELIDLYVAFVEEDYWGIVVHFGEGAYCAVANSLVGGSLPIA